MQHCHHADVRHCRVANAVAGTRGDSRRSAAGQQHPAAAAAARSVAESVGESGERCADGADGIGSVGQGERTAGTVSTGHVRFDVVVDADGHRCGQSADGDDRIVVNGERNTEYDVESQHIAGGGSAARTQPGQFRAVSTRVSNSENQPLFTLLFLPKSFSPKSALSRKLHVSERKLKMNNLYESVIMRDDVSD